MTKKKTVIDLFSGCGGLSLGFEKAGYEILAGIDHWRDAVRTFQHNHQAAVGIVADLSTDGPEILSESISSKNIDVIIGGPPCQGFSIAGKRQVEDERNQLYKSFVEFVAHFKPKAFVLENVPNIFSMGNGSVKENIINDFEKLGYKVVSKILLASNYGIPQNRKRAFFVGVLNGESFEFPVATTQANEVTAYDAISDLPENSVIDGEPYSLMPDSDYQVDSRQLSKSIFNHETTLHNENTVNIISLVPDGGNYKDLPEEFKDTRKVNIAWTRLNSRKSSFTIDTGHRHHFHYKFNRIPTVRESARIQSFPDNFIFLGSKTSQYKQVGNAVPPLLAKILAQNLIKYL